MARADRLEVLIGGQSAGELVRRGGRLTLRYADAWLSNADAVPVSLSLSMVVQEHSGDAVENFLRGLLPDHRETREAWARQFGIRASDTFGLLANMGEDCAGAVQFVASERVEAVLTKSGSVEWLNSEQLADAIAACRTSSFGGPVPPGRFSLAGAQDKLALLHDGTRFGVPSGATPSTHILKPEPDRFPGLALVEALCQELARAIGLEAARASVLRVRKGPSDTLLRVLVSERYDRLGDPTRPASWTRVHQEDFCQALGLSPEQKYQSEGGPSPADLARVLRTYSSQAASDIERFALALGFQWMIVGTDAHAKNYSLILESDERVRLAPLYDLVSFLPYDDSRGHQLRLAMKIGHQYSLSFLGRDDWLRLAGELDLEETRLVERLGDMGIAIRERCREREPWLAFLGVEDPDEVLLITALLESLRDACQRALVRLGRA